MSQALLSTSLTLSIITGLSNAGALATPNAPLSYSKKIDLSDGTGANQANQVWADQRTLTASSSESLDLSGTLTNAFGNTVNFSKIKGFAIVAAADNANDVVVGGAASNGFISWVGSATDTVKIKPGGVLFIAAPDANGLGVTASTADLLKVANSGSGSSVTYDIIVIGC